MENINFKKGFSLIEISIVLLIIGILISGILVGQDLILDAKIRSAQNLTRTSPVNKIPDLTLWLDVNAEKSLITTEVADRCLEKYVNYQDLLGNNVICAWQDINPQKSLGSDTSRKVALSINTSHTIATMPIYVIDGIGGLPSLYFDGADYLISSIPQPQTTNVANTIFNVDMHNLFSPSEVSFFIVQQYERPQSARAVLFHHLSNLFSIYNTRSGTDPNFSYDSRIDFASTTSQTTATTTLPTSSSQIISFIRENNSAQLYINSARQTITNNTPTSFSNNLSAPISVGAAISSATSGSPPVTTISATANTYFKGKISEIIVFNRKISERERVQVENYLLQKYKIKKT